jgi:hypothetical protein
VSTPPELEALLRPHPPGVPMTDEIVTALAEWICVADPLMVDFTAQVIRLTEQLHEIRT